MNFPPGLPLALCVMAFALSSLTSRTTFVSHGAVPEEGPQRSAHVPHLLGGARKGLLPYLFWFGQMMMQRQKRRLGHRRTIEPSVAGW